MRKIYNWILVFILCAISWSTSFASQPSLFLFAVTGPGNPSIKVINAFQSNFFKSSTHTQVIFKGTLGLSPGRFDTMRLRTSNLKDNRQVKPYLIFSAPTFNISRRLMLGSGSASTLAYNNLESQYQVTFNNFSVSSPIHDQLTLSYSLGRDNKVTAKIFNVLGTEVTTLFSEYQLAGQQHKVFNLADRVGTGIYILKLSAGNEQMAKRIQVL